MVNNFLQRKKDVLAKLDKSSKQSWDEKIVDLCNKINDSENYYTTSSCAGRIVIMKDQDKKEKGLFEFVSHELVDFENLKNELGKIKYLRDTLRAYTQGGHENLSRGPEKSSTALKSVPREKKDFSTKGMKLNLKFKQEPCIIHIACNNLENAEKLLNKGREAGWKKSGILSLGKNIIVELNSSEKLEFPFMKNGKILVDNNFLEIVLKKANENLEKSWAKIEKLRELL